LVVPSPEKRASSERSIAGEMPTSRSFRRMWKDADSDIPILITAKAEYSKLK